MPLAIFLLLILANLCAIHGSAISTRRDNEEKIAAFCNQFQKGTRSWDRCAEFAMKQNSEAAARRSTTTSGGHEDEDCSDCLNHCKWVKKIKYAEVYVPKCCMESREKCEYKTTYTQECADRNKRVCMESWKDDGYGGRVWAEDPSTCKWLQKSECMSIPHPEKVCYDYCHKPGEFIHKQVPQQHECEVCGGREKRCLHVESEHHGYDITEPCPVDCAWSEFKFTNCSNQCGVGMRNGTRSIVTPARHGGKNCTGPSEVTTQCNTDPGGAPSMFEVLEEDASDLAPCRKRKEEIKSCVRINVDFDIIDQSDRLKVFCTSVERKFEAGDNDTRFYEADNFAYLVLTRRNFTGDVVSQLGRNRRVKRQISFTANSRLGYRSIHGTFKIPGNGSYAIENCGPDCHVVVEVSGDNAIHPDYDEGNLVTDDSLLPTETQDLLRRGEDDPNTMATISVIIYYTAEFRRTTPDVRGHVEGLILNTNIAFENSEIPLRLTLYCFLEMDIGEAPVTDPLLKDLLSSLTTSKNRVWNTQKLILMPSSR